ncbi:MAG TPA: hypothetical protein GX699_03425 [Firmicutes bacterium]|jgi:hypothetical protein|nr:hypothetical protein [Bacillota bacterium]
MYKQAGKKDTDLLQQLSLRQEKMNGQVLQALQQALAAVVQAQQLLQQDMAYHQELRTGGDYSRLSGDNMSPQAMDKSGLPGKTTGTPPDLQ